MTNHKSSKETFSKKNSLNKSGGSTRSLPMEIGKMQPQAADLEEAILGAILLERDALLIVIDILTPETFYVDAHGRIFDAILMLFANNDKIDLLTVIQKLKDQGNLSLVGGAFYMTELTNRVASSAHIEYHARIIQELWLKREIIRVSSETTKNAYTDTNDIFEVIDGHQHEIFKILDPIHKRDIVPAYEAVSAAITELQNAEDSETGLNGVPSGLTLIDRRIGGWGKSDLIILAGRPAMGKTAYALTMLKNAAVRYNVPVVMFSLEMSQVQLTYRLLASETEIPLERFVKNKLTPEDWIQLNDKLGALSEAPLFIDDTPALSVMELMAKARRLKINHDIQLIIVDYLQLMTGDKKGNRENEISSISRSLKLVAKELNIPVIALSQLSRAVETRGGEKRPMLSDLRESGAIEQDADLVQMLYRPEYYGITEDEQGNSLIGVVEAITVKYRNGNVGTDLLNFIGKLTKFTDLDYDGISDDKKSPDITTQITPEPLEAFPNGFDLGNAKNLDIPEPSKKKPEDDMPF